MASIVPPFTTFTYTSYSDPGDDSVIPDTVKVVLLSLNVALAAPTLFPPFVTFAKCTSHLADVICVVPLILIVDVKAA